MGIFKRNRTFLVGAVLRALGFDEARIESAFGFMMEALEYGAPPHGDDATEQDGPDPKDQHRRQ